MSRSGPTVRLPAPDPAASELSELLRAHIAAEIDSVGGLLGFDRFMELALYAPGLGYYSAGLAKFGPGGDFITAPLVSPLFSRTLAMQCAQCLQALGGGVVLEFGAGSGHMAVEVLKELERRDCPPDRYLILEVSASLRQRQQELFEAELPGWRDRVEWLDSLPQTPLRGVVLANEVLDALPVKRFRRAEDTVEEWAVGVEDGEFVWQLRPADTALSEAVAQIEQDCHGPLGVGYSSEWSPRAEPWIAALADTLQQGVMLLIDYGYPRCEYYHPQRRMGTLVCHYRHHAHDDPLQLVGLQDITAFVDFTAVARAGVKAGLDVLGFAPQAQFLLGAGLGELMMELSSRADVEEQMRLAGEVKTLTLPGEMGERFKVLALGRDFTQPLAGFSLVDHTGRL